MTESAPATSRISPFAPFASRAFALLWTATLISNVGTWIHDVSASWLMTSLSSSPLVVALVQAATTAAMALFALPAGVLADIFDRKRLLMVIVLAKAAVAALIGILTVTGIVDAWSLLVITFILGTGSALIAPAWQSIVPTLVPRAELKPAVALNSLGINVARAIGPTIGGILIVSAGVAAAFFLNALSELVVLVALLAWKPVSVARPRAPEHFVSAMIAGMRYAAYAPALKVVLWRSVAFFLFASAFWALIPLVVRSVLQSDAVLYGLVVGAVGLGAVFGALALPAIDKSLGADKLVALGSAGMAAVLLVLAVVPVREIAIGAGLIAGIAWIFVLSSLNVAAQNALPDWVRGRGLSIYGLAFFGSMTAGAILWGVVASWLGIVLALVMASVGMLLGIGMTRMHPLSDAPSDLSPAGHWPEPTIALKLDNDAGPVMVTVEYQIDPARNAEFVATVQKLAASRRRDGAYQWGLMRDAADPSRYTEYFFLESWAEHERQHARVTRDDAEVQAGVQSFHLGSAPPIVRHFIYDA